MGQLSVFKHIETLELYCSGCSGTAQLKLTSALRELDFALKHYDQSSLWLKQRSQKRVQTRDIPKHKLCA